MSDAPVCRKCGGAVHKDGKTPAGAQRWTCNVCGLRSTKTAPARSAPTDLDPAAVQQAVREIIGNRNATESQRYVITSAQNNTGVHKNFLRSLETYCEHNTAELIVIPVRYRNPTGCGSSLADDATWYDTSIAKYLMDKPLILGDNVMICGDIKIQATAVDPLSGLETISGTRSAIFGHAQLRMKMVPTPQARIPKMLHTTGSVSLRNYSDTKAGAKGKHHHTSAALVVEVRGKTFHVRQLLASTGGSFQDLDSEYTPEGVRQNVGIEALVTGDEHAMFMSDDVRRATYDDADSIVKTLQPKILVRHDVLDFYSQNHHHKQSRLTRFAKATSGLDDVQRELDMTLEMIDATTPKGVLNVIVDSNHTQALGRWLNEYNPDRDPHNALIYHMLCAAVYSETTVGEGGVVAPDPFELYARGRLQSDAKFISNRKPYLIKGIDVSQHGDRGANGARGSINSFAASEYRMIVGHSHSPAIKFGAWQVGTSTHLQLEYNTGLSSWLNTHCLIYPNGKRALVSIIDGAWRLT